MVKAMFLIEIEKVVPSVLYMKVSLFLRGADYIDLK